MAGLASKLRDLSYATFSSLMAEVCPNSTNILGSNENTRAYIWVRKGGIIRVQTKIWELIRGFTSIFGGLARFLMVSGSSELKCAIED